MNGFATEANIFLSPVSFSATGLVQDSGLPVDGAIASAFAKGGAIVLRNFLQPALCDLLSGRWSNADFTEQSVTGVGARAVEAPGFASDALCLLLAQPGLLRWLEIVTSCPPLVSVNGDVAQIQAGSEQALDWHDDRTDRNRVLAITINLGTAPYEGGAFELRRKKAAEAHFRYIHRERGTAVIFAVRGGLEHRVLPVAAGGPRTVYSGWFMTQERP